MYLLPHGQICKLSNLHINLHINDMNEISKHEVEIVKLPLNYSPKPSLLHGVISTVIRFDKSLYQVVLYEKYVICIFMNNYENLENDEKIIEK